MSAGARSRTFGSNLFYNGSSWNLRNTGNDGWLTTMNNSPGGTSASAGWGIYHAASGTNPTTLSSVFFVQPGGNIGIGTTNPQYMLSVKGTIGAQEVIVTNTGWSDYVFKPDYRLRPLSEVAGFIKENHHLPDILTEAEVQEKGIGLGEMQAKLLAKVEELTLHMIQADERNNRLERQNQQLQQRIAKLEAPAATDGSARADAAGVHFQAWKW
jgi:hypothetical protein